jgi:hypothetical protein
MKEVGPSGIARLKTVEGIARVLDVLLGHCLLPQPDDFAGFAARNPAPPQAATLACGTVPGISSPPLPPRFHPVSFN